MIKGVNQRRRSAVPAWATDVLLALVVAAFQVQGVLVRGPGPTERPITDLGGVGVRLLVLSGLAIALRRRFPEAVFIVTASSSLIYFALDYSDGPGWLALFIALYTLTAYGDGRRSVRLAGISIAVLAVAWLISARDVEPPAAIGWVFFRIGASGMAAALGESTRARRLIAEEAEALAQLALQTREEEARARVAQERVRIAREVHDTVAHALAIVNVQAGVTAHVLDKRPERAKETLVAIEQTSSRALEEMRTILDVLRSDGEGREPLPGLIDLDVLLHGARDAGLDLKLEQSAPPSSAIPRAVGIAGYRIVQEALTNVLRHAGPTRVIVAVHYGPAHLDVSVADEGPRAAEEPETRRRDARGRGLQGMRERCELLGGHFEAGPQIGGGFTVRARLPFSPGTDNPA